MPTEPLLQLHLLWSIAASTNKHFTSHKLLRNTTKPSSSRSQPKSSNIRHNQSRLKLSETALILCCAQLPLPYIGVHSLPDPRRAGHVEAFQKSYVRPSVRPYVRLQFVQFCPTRPIYLGPPIFLQILDLLCIDY